MKIYNTALLHGCILKLLHKYYTVIVEVTNEIRTPFKTRKKQHGGWKKISRVKVLCKVMSFSYHMVQKTFRSKFYQQHTHWITFLQLLLLKIFVLILFKQIKIRKVHFGLFESSLHFYRRLDLTNIVYEK